MESEPIKVGWKQKLAHELAQYWIIFLYLAVFFGAFAELRRIVLAEYSISYLHYGIPLLKAAVLAKFVLIIDALRLGRKLEDRRLIYSVFYKVIVFTLNVLIFDLIEELIRGLCKGKGMLGVREQFASMNKYEALANCLVVFFAFVPFFAFREMARVLGREKMVRMFFGGKAGKDAEIASEKK